MPGEAEEVRQRPPIDDSSPVVLHARYTTFVMLIVSGLVVVGILVEDISRLKRAVDDAETIQGLMNLWNSATRDEDSPISVAHILAGPASEMPDEKAAFRLRLAPRGDRKGSAAIACRVDLDLGQRFFVPEKGPVQQILVGPSGKFESGSEFKVGWRGISGDRMWTEWFLKQPPYNLRSYSRFWDILVSSGGSARIDTAEIERNLARGISAFDQGITMHGVPTPPDKEGPYWLITASPHYQVVHVKMLPDDSRPEEKETAIAPVGRYVRPMNWSGDAQPLRIMVLRTTEWNDEIQDWKDEGFDTAAVSVCRGSGGSESRTYPVVFPVKLWTERFAWTDAWIDRAIAHGHLSKELRPKMSNKLRLPFAQAFADLHLEVEDLESLELDALHGWLQGRLDRRGRNIEVAGIGIPRPLLSSLGLFLIIVFQGYAARHLSEAASRMKFSADGDPGAFQAWIVLYDGLLSLSAAICIVVAPTGAALIVVWVLYEGGFWTPYVFASGSGLIASLMLTSYSVRSLLRLRIETQRHRETAARNRAEQSLCEAGAVSAGARHGSEHEADPRSKLE
ncbi:MAG: hypothetical protein OXF11_16910 [Deltaproteobacteria bacterium]|nr:hypothetical protein [Deltaproteobacteria bacterium]